MKLAEVSREVSISWITGLSRKNGSSGGAIVLLWNLRGVGFRHADNRQGGAVAERDFDVFEDAVAASEIKWNAGEGGAHFEARKASGAGGGFAGLENFGADAASRPVWMDEESADLGGVGCGIEKIWFADESMVAAEECFAMAPSSATDDYSCTGRSGFGDKIGAVGDQLRVEAEKCAECAVDLFGCVIVFL